MKRNNFPPFYLFCCDSEGGGGGGGGGDGGGGEGGGGGDGGGVVSPAAYQLSSVKLFIKYIEIHSIRRTSYLWDKSAALNMASVTLFCQHG